MTLHNKHPHKNIWPFPPPPPPHLFNNSFKTKITGRVPYITAFWLLHVRTKQLIAWRAIVQWQLKVGQGYSRSKKREMCLWWMCWFMRSDWATCGYCGCLPTRHSKKDARFSWLCFEALRRRRRYISCGNKCSASPEKWKAEDLARVVPEPKGRIYWILQ